MGVQISGDTGNVLATKGTYTGNLTVGGVLTYEDVTNVDSVGLVTARSGIEIGARPGVAASISVDGNMIVSGITTFTPGGSEVVRINSGGLLAYNDVSFFGASTNAYWDKSANQFLLNDNTKIALGSSSDLLMFHDGTNNYIGTQNGNIILNKVSGTEKMIQAIPDGAVELYHDNSKKFETISTGVVITGSDDGDGGAKGDFKFFQTDGTLKIMFDASTSQFEFLDDSKATFGSGDDLKLYHSSNNSYVANDTGYLYIQSDSISLAAKSAGENYLVANKDGAVSIYHDNVERLTTTTQGVDVYVAGNSGLRIRGNVADVDPRIVFRRKNNDGGNAEAAAIVMEYQGGTTYESGHLDFYTNGDSGSAALARRVRIRNDGALLINTTTQTSLGSQTGASNVVTVNRSGIVLTAYSVVAGFYYDRINYTNSQYYIVNDSGTGVYLGNGSTSWSANSDERLKINITELDGTKAYNHVKTARATSFNWNATGHSTDKKIGFIAQDWETNYPEVVSTSTETVDAVENPKGIRYTETVPVLMAALKEAIAKIETLETEVAALKSS